ncbi:MAG: 3-dehydroquinate synthase [Campylobacterales bacterium]
MEPIKLRVEAASKEYPILIGELPKLHFQEKVAIITNPKVGGLHLNYLLSRITAPELYIVTLPDGEEYKNWESVNYGLERLFDHQLDRNSLLIGFGGGVIGDMTGFIASIFLRGIKFLQIPTTLLAMVDSSVGGKTGINNRYGKNLIGTFYQPEGVYIDSHFLKTLPPREFNAGMAEIIKMAVMFDRKFFEELEKGELPIELQIKRAVELKAEVVKADERERGLRSVLNYGHTFGHVIENLTNYRKYLHGEAVAIGIGMANRLAEKLGLLKPEERKRIEALLCRHNLPLRFPVEDPEEFYTHFFLDKKTTQNRLKFILPNGIGNFKILRDPPKEIVLKVLEGYREGQNGGN